MQQIKGQSYQSILLAGQFMSTIPAHTPSLCEQLISSYTQSKLSCTKVRTLYHQKHCEGPLSPFLARPQSTADSQRCQAAITSVTRISHPGISLAPGVDGDHDDNSDNNGNDNQEYEREAHAAARALEVALGRHQLRGAPLHRLPRHAHLRARPHQFAANNLRMCESKPGLQEQTSII